MGKWITCVCLEEELGGGGVGGGCYTDTHAPAQGQAQCVISVLKSDTRCQWNAAECARGAEFINASSFVSSVLHTEEQQYAYLKPPNVFIFYKPPMQLLHFTTRLH